MRKVNDRVEATLGSTHSGTLGHPFPRQTPFLQFRTRAREEFVPQDMRSEEPWDRSEVHVRGPM